MDAANPRIMICIKCQRDLKLVTDSWQSRCRTIHVSKIQSSRPKFDFPPFPLPHSKKAIASIVTHKATFITFTTFKTYHFQDHHIFTKFITDSPRIRHIHIHIHHHHHHHHHHHRRSSTTKIKRYQNRSHELGLVEIQRHLPASLRWSQGTWAS